MDTIIRELVDQLGQTARLSDACAVVLEGAADRVGIDRAVVAIEGLGQVECVGYGVAGDRMDALRAALQDADGSARLLFASEEPSVLRADDRLPDLGFDSFAVVPFRVPPVEGRGLVLLAAEELDGRAEFVARAFRRCGAALGRCMQLERLEARTGRLERERRLLTGVTNALPDPVLLTDADNNILLANERAESLFVAEPSDSEGRRQAILMNNLLFTAFRTQATMTRGGAPTRELTLVDPTDGSDLVFEVLSDPLPDEPGSQGAVVSVLRDITDLKQAVTELEREYQRSRAAEHRARQEWERLTVILENVGDPILVTDDKSNTIHMNREAERLFDVPVSFGPESPRRRLVRANDTRFTGLVSDFLLQSADRRVEELELSDPDTGQTFPVEVVSSKILNRRGEPTAIVSILHDLTQVRENERLARELKELNEGLEARVRRATEELEEHNQQLEWQSRELEKASRLKSEFLANMSHELRTPINAMLGYASIVREGIYGDLTEEQGNALDKISVAARHLLALINDILDLSKIEAGQMLVHVTEFRLEDLVAEVSETVAPLVREKSLLYRVDLPEELPPLRSDETKVRQVLLNLLSNAIKFTHEGGVTVRASVGEVGEAAERVRITVADTGIGIPEDQLERIFEDFRQADQSSTKEYAGTGLGLSITRKLLSLLGGGIAVESEYGEGSCFTIDLPVWTEEQSASEQVRRAIVGADEAVVRR